MERFAQAAEDLLQDRAFEEISVHDIARRARRPIGSFYARFKSKDAMLPHLYERYDASLAAVFEARLVHYDWDSLGFMATIEAIVDFVIVLFDQRRWLIRTLALFARLRPEALPSSVESRRRELYERVVARLARHRASIRHANPEAAIRFGLFMVESVAREKLLFDQAPHARITPLSRRALREELVRALHGYLSCEAPA